MDDGASSYRRFLDGDWDGLMEIIDAYYDGLVLYLNRYLNNPQDAEDMAEETILTLTTKRPSFRGQSSFKTWLYAIGRNNALCYLRKTHREMPVSGEDLAKFAQEGSTALEECVREEEKHLLHGALQRLPEEYRRVLWLKYGEDMSVKEIALAMNRTNHSVNGLLKRARAALREELAKEGYHEKP